MFSNIDKKFDLGELIHYQAQLPDSLEVRIRKSEDGGYWVKVLNLPGCFTQADNGEELFVMINDAVYTYFDIPEKYIPFVIRYFPPESERKKFKINIPPEFLQKPITFFPQGAFSVGQPSV